MYESQEYLFAMRDRLGGIVDRCRSVCSKKYKYIRNYVDGLTYYDSGHKNVAGATSGLPLFKAASYIHLTLPTTRIVYQSVVV